MKKQLFYRHPGADGNNSGGDTEEPIDETFESSADDSNTEDGATDEDTVSDDETSTEDGASDENTTPNDDGGPDNGAVDEDATSDDEPSSEDGTSDENTTSENDTGSEDGATDEDTNSEDEGSSEDGASDENTKSENDTASEDGATDEDTKSEDEGNSEDGASDEDTTSGDENSSEDNAKNEDNTFGGTSKNSDSGDEESTTDKNEPEHDKIPLEEESFSGNSTVAAPAALVWPTNFSNTPVTSPGEELTAFITSVKTNRTSVPEHLTDKNKVKNGYMFDPFAGKSQPQPASIQPDTVDAWIWEELRSEGSYTSINTYDNMIVTWGRGVAGANIAKVLKSLFSSHPDIETEFKNVGIGLNTNGILQVVDTNQNCVKEGNFALQTIKADKKLLDFLVDISLKDQYKDIFLDAQWNFVKTSNASLFSYVATNKWSKDAVQLMFHFNWWLPAYAWAGHSQNYKDTGGNEHKIIYLFASYLNKNSTLVSYLKRFAGNAFGKYVAKPAYESQPAGEHLIFEDGSKTYYFPKL